jgi:hypothetical protein
MSTDEDTNNLKPYMTETDSDDVMWDKKLETHKLEEEQQKKDGSENDTDTNIDEVDDEQHIEDMQSRR